MKNHAAWWVIALLVLVAMATSTAAQPTPEPRPVNAIGDRWIAIGGGARLPAFATHSLDGPRPEIETAVIVIHGLARDAGPYFAGMTKAVASAESSGLLTAAKTLVVAPQFLSVDDSAHHRLPADGAYWATTGWPAGDAALSPASRPTSFAALDALVEGLLDRARFPALRRLVVAGHSAGGQLLHRYAVAGRADEATARTGVDVRYVIANPSSYLYLSDQRPAGDGFAPFPAARCLGFDDYRYGLRNAPEYVTARPLDTLLKEYRARHVVYLLGTADSDPNHRALDKSCAALAQGPHRLARGEAFYRHLLTVLGPDAARTHRKMLVEGVGHDGARMFQSQAGLAALFGPW